MKIGAVFPHLEIGDDPVVIRDWAQTCMAGTIHKQQKEPCSMQSIIPAFTFLHLSEKPLKTCSLIC